MADSPKRQRPQYKVEQSLKQERAELKRLLDVNSNLMALDPSSGKSKGTKETRGHVRAKIEEVRKRVAELEAEEKAAPREHPIIKSIRDALPNGADL